jgi:hypothetical protein
VADGKWADLAEAAIEQHVVVLGRGSVEDGLLLARLYLDPDTITRVREESAMSIPSYEQDVYDQVHDEALAAGHAAGLAEGQLRARQAMLAAMLRRRFGLVPGVTAAASRLARLDVDEAPACIERAESVDVLTND